MKEEAKSEGHNSDDEEEFNGKILRAIDEEGEYHSEHKEDAKAQDDHLSELSSLPSQTDEESVAAIIKSRNVKTNELKELNLV